MKKILMTVSMVAMAATLFAVPTLWQPDNQAIRQRVFKVTLTTHGTPYQLLNQAAITSLTTDTNAGTVAVVTTTELRVATNDNVLVYVASSTNYTGIFPVVGITSTTQFAINIPWTVNNTNTAALTVTPAGTDYINAGQKCARARLIPDLSNTAAIQIGPDSAADTPVKVGVPSGGYAPEYILVDQPPADQNGPKRIDLSNFYVQSTADNQVVWVWMENQ